MSWALIDSFRMGEKGMNLFAWLFGGTPERKQIELDQLVRLNKKALASVGHAHHRIDKLELVAEPDLVQLRKAEALGLSLETYRQLLRQKIMRSASKEPDPDSLLPWSFGMDEVLLAIETASSKLTQKIPQLPIEDQGNAGVALLSLEQAHRRISRLSDLRPAKTCDPPATG